jgi:hypothetical protein
VDETGELAICDVILSSSASFVAVFVGWWINAAGAGGGGDSP